jgi:hypothetical protein
VAAAKYKYTLVAQKAASLAELFASQFEKGLDGPVRFRVELATPDGPSTAGGKQALQHIKLAPEGGGPAIVIGSANAPTMLAEIRTYEHIAALYAQRFHGAPIPVDVTRYYELGQAIATFFRAMGMQVVFLELDGGASGAPGQLAPPQGMVGPASASSGGARTWVLVTILLVGLVGLAALGVAYALFVRR